MPPRKSNASNASGGDANAPVPLTGAQVQQAAAEKSGYSIEDLAFPRTMVSRLAKSAVPPNTQMARDAQWAVWKSATVFVNYLASNAAEHAGRTSKKTIQPSDVIDAVRDLELPNFTVRLEAEIAKWNENQAEKKVAAKARAKDRAAAAVVAKTGDAKAEGEEGGEKERDMEKYDEDEAAAQLAAEAGAARMSDSPKAGAKGGARSKTADGEPAKKRARRSTVGEGEAAEDEDEEEVEEGQADADSGEDEEEDEDEDEDQEEAGEGAHLHPEDALEEKGSVEDEDEAMDSDGSD